MHSAIVSCNYVKQQSLSSRMDKIKIHLSCLLCDSVSFQKAIVGRLATVINLTLKHPNS